MTTQSAAVVIPCYNEATRLDLPAFRSFLQERSAVRLILVNDGSTDSTLHVLQLLATEFPEQVEVIDQQPNRGKAEAVRVGLLVACDRAPIVGFWDADLATPFPVMAQFLTVLKARPDIQWVLGSRVKLLGRQIDRNDLRHYLGRIFATGASIALQLGVYDTQCGAKFFRATPLFKSLLEQQFRSHWVFDVELIARLTAAHRKNQAPAPKDIIFEAPLNTWRDVKGSKVKPTDFIKGGLELAIIWWYYLRATKLDRNSA